MNENTRDVISINCSTNLYCKIQHDRKKRKSYDMLSLDIKVIFLALNLDYTVTNCSQGKESKIMQI